jgi:hypothetical protein
MRAWRVNLKGFQNNNNNNSNKNGRTGGGAPVPVRAFGTPAVSPESKYTEPAIHHNIGR